MSKEELVQEELKEGAVTDSYSKNMPQWYIKYASGTRIMFLMGLLSKIFDSLLDSDFIG